MVLKINRAAFEAFNQKAHQAFPAEVAEKLRKERRQRTAAASDAELLAFVETTISEARKLGLTWRSSLWAFVLLSVDLHPQFYRHPKVNAALKDDPFDTPDHRMRRLGATVSDGVWLEIAQSRRRRDGLG